MSSSALVQMNVRMQGRVKEAGDAVLAEAGTTPTQIVRALWEKISRGAADLQQVEEVLGMSAPIPSQDETARKLDAMRRGRELFAEGLATLNVRPSADVSQADVSSTEQYVEALTDRLRERDLW